MAKLVILTLELIEARALLEAVEQVKGELNQYHGVTQLAVNKLRKGVQRASVKHEDAWIKGTTYDPTT